MSGAGTRSLLGTPPAAVEREASPPAPAAEVEASEAREAGQGGDLETSHQAPVER